MNIINLELRKILNHKCIYIGILLSLITGGVMTYVAFNNPDFFQFKHTQAFYSAYFIQIVIIYLIVDNIYLEYNQGTLKLLCNNNSGITKVFINKLICLLLTAIILAVVNIIFNLIAYKILSPNIDILTFSLQIFVTYLLYVLTIYSTTILIYSFSKKNIFTLCFLILLFYLSHDIIGSLSSKFNISENVLDLIPFYSLGSGMQGFYFNIYIVIGSLIWSAICLGLGLFNISKQDIC